MRTPLTFSSFQVSRYFRSRYFEDLDRVYDIRISGDMPCAGNMSLDGRRPESFRFHPEENFFLFSAITAYILSFERALSVTVLDERVPSGSNNYYIVNDFAKITGVPVFSFGLPGLHPAIEHLIRGAGLFSIGDHGWTHGLSAKENFLAAAETVFPFMEVMFEAFLMGAELPTDKHGAGWRRFRGDGDYDVFVDKVSGHYDEVVALMKSEIRRFMGLLEERPAEEFE